MAHENPSAAPELTGDAWTEKARPAAESAAWKKWGATVSNPDTTESELRRIAEAVKQNTSRLLVLEAIASHPNAPPDVLQTLIPLSRATCRAFCQNPIAPLLLWETPGFVSGLNAHAQHVLLRDALAPPAMVSLMAESSAAQNEAVQREARLHVAFAGEADTRAEWESNLRDYWQTECTEVVDTNTWHGHIDLTEIGLAPSWAKGNPPFPEPLPNLPFSDALETWFKFTPAPGSREEKALLLRLDDTVRPRKILAKGLQTGATIADLRTLLRACGKNSDGVRRAILRHASTDAALIRDMAKSDNESEYHFMVINKHTPPDVLARILQCGDPQLRRLARRHKNAPPAEQSLWISRRAFTQSPEKTGRFSAPFISFVGSLHAQGVGDDLPEKTERHLWTQRLEAALSAPLTTDLLPRDKFHRTGLALLSHLAWDGNRIVRAVAKTRLDDPDYRFSLWENAEETGEKE